MDSLVPLLICVACLILQGLFSGGELALVSADINRVRHLAKKGNSSAILALSFLERPDWFLATTLAGTNICVITATATATAFFISSFGAGRGELISALVMVPTQLILGEIVPKSLFQQWADRVALRVSWLIWIASFIMYPLVFLISRISRGTVGIAWREKELNASYITKSGLRHLLISHGTGSDMLAHEQAMVQRILDFSELTVGRVIVSLSTMTALPVTASIEQAAALFAEKKYLRIPVYRDQIFNILGIINYYDLLYAMKNPKDKISAAEPLDGICQKNVLFVPENKLAKELLLEMRERNEQMAIVVDEYGGAVGIVTIEDILAEILGELDDHQDAGYRRLAAGRYIFQAQISLEKINQLLPVPIPEADYETLAGFLLARMGRIPRRSETHQFGLIRFVIEDADVKTIREVMVIFPPEMDKN